MKDYREDMRRDGERIRQLTEKIHKEFAIRPHGDAHHAATNDFHRQYYTLAFPGGLWEMMEKLKDGDTDAIEVSIQYLEAKPRCFRSGYIAEEILHKLKHVTLTDDQVSRLVKLIVDSIGAGPHRVFMRYTRLARVLGDPRIRAAADKLIDDQNPETRRRVQHVLQVITS